MADFVAPQAKLVVEVDGPCHERRRAAARRDRKLARLGYRGLRLETELVMRQLPAALLECARRSRKVDSEWVSAAFARLVGVALHQPRWFASIVRERSCKAG